MKILRVSALLLAGALGVSTMTAYAQSIAAEDFGEIQENRVVVEEAEPVRAEGDYGLLHWKLTQSGVLTVSGTASMEPIKRAPWLNDRTKIEAVVIAQGVTGVSGFQGCTALKKVTLADTVNKIGDRAFSGCTALERIDHMQSMKEIGESAFEGCSALRSIVLPEGIAVIKSGAFRNSGLESVKVPSSVKQLGYAGSVFAHCEHLKTADIGSGNGSFSIPAECFRGCSALESITVGDAVTYIRENAFSDCRQLQYVAFGNQLSGIGWMAFSDCTALSSIHIPDMTQVLEYGCFSGCTSLSKIFVGKGIRSLKGNNFSGCTALREIYFNGNMPDFANNRVFMDTNTTAYYPEHNKTWKRMDSYGGNLVWEPWLLPISHYQLTIKTIAQKKGGVKIVWNTLHKADGYQIYRRTGSGKWKRIGRSRTTTFLDRTAKKGKTYSYRAAAYRGEDWSKRSKAKTITLLH